MSRLYLITGFLGAGKTTFLKNFMNLFRQCRIHLIVNEFGKEGVDGTLLAGFGAQLDEINNGSIFCSCRLDKFEETLQTVLRNEPDIILVEASGLSNPVNVRKILTQKCKFPNMEYMGSLCLVDAKQFQKVYETAAVVKKQIGISDILILNKIDLATKEQIEDAKHILMQHRPDLMVYETSFGRIRKEWMECMKAPEPVPEELSVQTMDITLRSLLLHINGGCTYDRFRKFVVMFIEDTYRIKGFVSLEDTVYLVDCVGSIFQAEPYEGKTEHNNCLVVLSGNGLPTKKSVQRAMDWYPELVETIE